MMKFNYSLLLTLLFGISSSAFAVDSMVLHIEIRTQNMSVLGTNTEVEFVTDTTSAVDWLNVFKQKEEFGFRIYQKSYNLFAREKRRAILVYTYSKSSTEPELVFLLPIPRKAKPTDWTGWLHANYVERGDAGWNFINGINSVDRSTNIAPNSYELRYKVTGNQS